MLRVTVLGSGSRGNAIVVDGTEGSLLIDAGFGPRALQRRLAAAGRRTGEIGSLLLTHEHTDHACGAVDACRRFGWTLRATVETLAEVPGAEPDPGDADAATRPLRVTSLARGAATRFDGWEVSTVAVPHDARDCQALVLTDVPSGERVGIALDLGHVPAPLPSAFARLDLVVVESNHDERMLASGPYPWMLKRRIGGDLGHLSNGATAAFLCDVAHRGLRGVVLAHLSETNNTPVHAIDRSRDALRRAGWRRDAIWAAPQGMPCGPYGVDGATTNATPVQLGLGL